MAKTFICFSVRKKNATATYLSRANSITNLTLKIVLILKSSPYQTLTITKTPQFWHLIDKSLSNFQSFKRVPTARMYKSTNWITSGIDSADTTFPTIFETTLIVFHRTNNQMPVIISPLSCRKFSSQNLF